MNTPEKDWEDRVSEDLEVTITDEDGRVTLEAPEDDT